MSGHTYSDCLFHVVFSTKERRSFPLEQMQHLHRYMVGIAKNNNFKVIVAGGIADHVHLLITLPTSIPIAKAVQALKGGSSKWFNEQNAKAGFAWQAGSQHLR
ncbi:MAG TPA: IS200/IS605 family transposase [Terriglobales bacterium]|nr:IS200/IS605 family transposase [Terriglobales bacterium]